MADQRLPELDTGTVIGTTLCYVRPVGQTRDQKATLDAIVAGGLKALPAGSAAAPTIAFGDGDSGIYEVADDQLGISLAGTVRFFVASPFLAGASTTAGGIVDEAVSVTNPTLIIARNDLDTGIGGSTDRVSLIAGGVELLRVNEVVGANQVIVSPGVIVDDAATPVLAFGAGGKLTRTPQLMHSSARRLTIERQLVQYISSGPGRLPCNAAAPQDVIGHCRNC